MLTYPEGLEVQCLACVGQGVRIPPPLEIHKTIGVIAILVWIPLKSQSYQASIQCWAIIGTPAKRHLKIVFRWQSNSGIWTIPLPIKLKKI